MLKGDIYKELCMELLVHASAPSSKRDDEKFKRQVRNYSGFEVVNTKSLNHNRGATSQETDEDDAYKSNSNFSAKRGDMTDTERMSSVFLDDTQLARTALESQLITSSLVREPILLGLDANANPETGQVLEFANSLLPDHAQETSFHEKDQPLLKRRQSISPIRSPGKRLHVSSPPFVPTGEDAEFFLGCFRSQPVAGASFSTIVQGQAHEHVVEPRQSTCSRSDDIPSQLPSTYALSDVTSGSSPGGNEHPLSSIVQVALSTRSRGVGRTAHPISSPLRRSSRTNTGFILLPWHGVAHLPPNIGMAVDRHSNAENVSKPSTLRSENDSEPLVEDMDLAKSGEAKPDRNLEKLPKDLSITIPQIHEDLWIREADRPDRSEGEQHAAEAINKEPFSELEVSTRQDHPRLQVAEFVVSTSPPPRLPTKTFTPALVTPHKPAQVAELKSLSISIDPGPPPTSSDLYISHITQALAHLSNLPMLKGAYRPGRISRALRQSERGHWLVDSSRWPAGTQISFWHFLEEYVGTGKFGWGIWCTRELDHQSDGNHSMSQASGQTTEPQSSLGQIKVFCWGEVVKHVWQVLFVASKAQIRRGNPAWIDADGKVVVQMKRGEEEENKN